MSLALHRLLRLANRLLRAILPSHRYERVRRAAKAALTEYRRGHGPALRAAAPSILSPRVGRDALAVPVAPMFAPGGHELAPGKDLAERLARLREPCALVLCSAFAGRHDIVRHVVEEALSANHGREIRWFLVGSSAEDMALIRSLALSDSRVSGLVVENRPLGRKWQSCVHYAMQSYDAELYGITGSDDFISRRLADHVIDRHRRNVAHAGDASYMPSMYGTLEWLVCNANEASPHAPNIIRCNYEYESAFQPLGAGRFYTRAHMERRKGLLFESNKDRLLDDRGYFDLRDGGRSIEYYGLDDGPLVSFKGNWEQMNGIEAFLSAPTVTLREFSFEGSAMIAGSMSPASARWILGTTSGRTAEA